ncbi:hypothetical protein [Actinophytocola sp.]|uniref:hypothetical protein n=1 Tax=Actinophytocola sp. TaxID=1872138 RepID=UPI002D7F2B83|nr:hypothetical protein [Actinophytocola sp.]HET9138526.1 hypothetical protein [Actinophytocola sp.]HEU5108178.1 hypothetical protein [Micromonosporaceae bacterium]
MNEDIVAELNRFQHRVARLQNLITDAEDQAPDTAEGSDESGTVHVVLGPDGLPASFRVDTDFDRELKPEEFGDAVLRAFQAAMGARLAGWSQTLRADGWPDRLGELRSDPADPAPPVFRPPPAPARQRGLGELTEDMIKAFDNVDRLAARPAPVLATGSSGRLELTLSQQGLVSCVADPGWVSDQTAARLMNALAEALAEAKAELTEWAEEPAPARPLDRLLGEALALLTDPRRLAGS